MPCECVAVAYLGLTGLISSSPRTVAFDIERWANESWGLHNIYRDRISGTVAVYQDGSRVNNANGKHFRHYFIPSGQTELHNIYNRPQDILYVVDEQAKTATVDRCTSRWEIPPPPAPDRECAVAAKIHLGNATRMGSDTVAGIAVVRYLVTGDGSEHEAAFAPQFGCDVLEERLATYNTIGLPTSRYHFVVRSYVSGEPNSELLSPPPGYVVKQ
jgi:hypothetical protein